MRAQTPAAFLQPMRHGLVFLIAAFSGVSGAAMQEALRADTSTPSQPARRAEGVVLPQRLNSGAVIKANVGRTETQLSALRVTVKSFKVENSPFVSTEELDRILSPYRNRDLSFDEFEYVVHLVADYLRGNGHPKAEVSLSRAGLSSGVVAIALNGLSGGKEVSPTMTVREFRLEGLTVASADELKPVLEPFSNRELSVKQMQEAAQAVAVFLRGKGYPLAQAFLPPQRIDTGLIRVQVLEGMVEAEAGQPAIVVSSPGKRVAPEVIAALLEPTVQAGQALKAAPLDRALTLAGELAGVKSVRAELNPGGQPGTTRVTARVEEAPLVTGSVSADNYGSPFIGENRLNTQINLNSPFGRGEQFSLLTTDSSRLESRKLVAQTPVGSSGMRVGAAVSNVKVQLGQNFLGFDLNSKTDIESLFASYPLVRSARQNLTTSLTLDKKQVVNNLQGFRENDRRLDVYSLALSGDAVLSAGGQMVWNTSYTNGDVNLDGNAAFKARDAAGPRTQNGFDKFNGFAALSVPLGALSSGWSAYASLAGQKANNNLDSIEKFQLGGPSGVRAYPSGEGLGDSGLLASAEIRKSLAQFDALGELTGFLFVDAGTVRQNESRFANDLLNRPNQYNLKGYGVGASLGKTDLGVVRVVFAKKIGDNPNPTATGTDVDGRNDSSRVLIYLNAQF